MDEDDFDKKYKDTDIWVYEKPTDSEFKIKKYNVDDLKETLIRNYIVTPAGCLFMKHDEQLGILNDIVKNFLVLRKKIKKKRDSFPPDSFEYRRLDGAQVSLKQLANTIAYGIICLVSYRFNEKNIGNSITISGRCLIKTSQYIAQKVIEEMFK